MPTFEERFEAIRKASVEQVKSVNIDVRAYRGEWVAGVGGVQVCVSNSLATVFESIEKALGVEHAAAD